MGLINKKISAGFTLVELLVTMLISSILLLVVGVLLIGGQRSWEKIYGDANSEMRQGSHAIMAAFGSIGRRSNRLNYTLYKQADYSYIPSEPETSNSEEIVYGDAVEFRYWSASAPDASLLDVTNTGTDYAFFYIEDGEMKVDYGSYPPGAVPGGSGSKNTADITTTVLAENVVPYEDGAFNHTTISGVGQGSVRINVTLEDEDDPEKSVKVITATLMRNIWPR
ncbi:MAG: prepilin-type N-terminal cleavage/methylation domain-containing protein [Sedimentisphaerales bacterium]|nr:prepilin-type N-terminal cleavage/methylation domain-containing protein [Sedimentisphaerales bacterium]